MQLYGNDGATSRNGIACTNSAVLSVKRCLFLQEGTSGYSLSIGTTGKTVTSSIFINDGTNTIGQNFDTQDDIINCTFVRTSTAARSATAQQQTVGWGRPDFENCAFFSGGAAADWFAYSGSGAFEVLDYCATDAQNNSLTDLAGEGTNNIYALSQANQFVSVTGSDWSLKSGNDLDTGGVDRTSTVPVDIWGNSFNAGDIGCEASAAGASSNTDILIPTGPIR